MKRRMTLEEMKAKRREVEEVTAAMRAKNPAAFGEAAAVVRQNVTFLARAGVFGQLAAKARQ